MLYKLCIDYCLEQGSCDTTVCIFSHHSNLCFMLFSNLLKLFYLYLGSQRDWSRILKQKGWFCFPGITKDQVRQKQIHF